MCGRFTLTASAEKLQEFFPLFDVPALLPRYNIAPTQMVAALRQLPEDKPQFCQLRWGLIPSWAKDKKIGASLINARADTVATKPAFRAAFKRRRCLILADGFYEWRTMAKKVKQPYHIHLRDRRPFAFAGLWETWQGEDQPLESCTIITTEANELIQTLHVRMPVILAPKFYSPWLDPAPKDPGIWQELLQPFPAEEMALDAVSTTVNNVRNQGPDCLREAEVPAPPQVSAT